MGGELRGQFVERDGAAEEAVGERLGALERAVGKSQAPRMLGGEMRGAELDHLPRADEQHALLGDRWVDLLRESYRGGRHRYRRGADFGLGAHRFRDREGALKQ